MRFCVSSIGWDWSSTFSMLPKLRAAGVTGIELAPTMAWPQWSDASEQKARDLKRRIDSEGMQIPAFQAILFGRPELQLFNRKSTQDLLDHLVRVAELAAALETTVLVFGSPKNRRRNLLSHSMALSQGVEVFGRIAELIDPLGVVLGIEHNPIEYAADFLTCPADVREIVSQVAHRAIQLHFDTGGILMLNGSIAEEINSPADMVHYHVSAPYLEPVSQGEQSHREAAHRLKECHYDGWVSLEMKKPEDPEDLWKSVSNMVSWYR